MKPAEIAVLVGLALIGVAGGFLVTSNNLPAPAAAPPVADDPQCEQQVVNMQQHALEARQHLEAVHARTTELESLPLPVPD